MKKPRSIKFCPQCQSTHTSFEISDAGNFDICKDCGFRGMFPEKDLDHNTIEVYKLKE